LKNTVNADRGAKHWNNAPANWNWCSSCCWDCYDSSAMLLEGFFQCWRCL